MTRAHHMAVLASATMLAGCTRLGGNVKGDFACRAPSGSCAPMSAIDARAVESFDTDRTETPHKKGATLPLIASRGGIARRTGEQTLKIVFPAYMDDAGVLHDEATAHAVIEAPSWTFAPARPSSVSPEISRSFAPSSLREAIAGASAPAIEGLEPLPTRAPHPIIGIDAPALPTPPGGPSPEVLAAARAGHRIARPSVAAPRRSSAQPSATGYSLPRGKVAPTNRGESSDAKVRVRDLAKPALAKLGKPQAATSDGDLGDPFKPSQPKARQP